MMSPVWMTLAQALNQPLAVAIGHGSGVLARKRGDSFWAAWAYALIPGLVLAGVSEYWFGAQVQWWPNALVWLSWSAFGTLTGCRQPRRKRNVTVLNLSGRE